VSVQAIRSQELGLHMRRRLGTTCGSSCECSGV